MNTLPIESNGDDLYVTFTDDLLEELGWDVGDDLDWEVQTDGSITLTKHDKETTTGGPSRPLTPVPECLAAYGTPIHDC